MKVFKFQIFSNLIIILLLLIFLCGCSNTSESEEEDQSTDQILTPLETPVNSPLNLVSNGGFESPLVTKPYETAKYIDGWKITKGSVDLVGSYWEPSEGFQSLDLSYLSSGIIEQVIKTEPGQFYSLYFDIARYPDYYKSANGLKIYWDGYLIDYRESIGTSSKDDPLKIRWQRDIYYENLTATTGYTKLIFESTKPYAGPDCYGPILDNIRVYKGKVTIITEQPTVPPLKWGDLALIESHSELQNGRIEYIVGTIKNMGEKKYRSVRVEINLYDSNYTQIGNTYDEISNLEPHSTWKFKAYIPNKDTKNYKISEIVTR